MASGFGRSGRESVKEMSSVTPTQIANQSLSQAEKQASEQFIERLPLTLQPIPRQQVEQWDSLFPFERKSLLRFLNYLKALDEEEFQSLLRPLRQLEAKMGVQQWRFSAQEDTIENASLLARSAYYQDWRREVQRVFDIVNQSSVDTEPKQNAQVKRLVLLIFPEVLPLDPNTAWKAWHGTGRELRLASPARGLWEQLLCRGPEANGLVGALAQRAEHAAADVWLVDAGAALLETARAADKADRARPPAISLSYSEVKGLRENLLERLNTIQKDMTQADVIRENLQHADWTPWCPPALVQDKAVRDFLVTLFLSGNGSPIFANSFVEWASSEAFRRARPMVLAARFGTRAKPKPFTSVAIFENQENVSPLPNVEDAEGSAVDAAILARYVWLAALRYQEYSQALCLCVSERLATAYAVAPDSHPLWREQTPISAERLSGVVSDWLEAVS